MPSTIGRVIRRFLQRGRIRNSRPRSIAFFLSGILLGTSVGLASGAIPSATGTFSACYDSGGNMKVIDPAITPTCPKGFKGPITWSQTGPGGAQGIQGPIGPTGTEGPQGDQGEQGVPGPTGEPGPAGPIGPTGEPGRDGSSDLATLEGSACEMPGGDPGTVTVAVAVDGAITLTCIRTPTYCEVNTPPPGGHMTVECDDESRTYVATCDRFWHDLNDDVADGCEVSVGQALVDRFFPAESDIAVPSDCAGSVPIGCVGGVPLEPPATIHASASNVVAVEVVGASRFDASANLRLSTAGIPISIPLVGDCTMEIDTSPGANPDVKVFVPITFVADAADPTLIRVVLGDVTLTQLTTDDVALTGSFGCAFADLGLEFFIGTLVDTLVDSIRFTEETCLVPEPELFGPCPS